jgi:hypothetical protein
MVEIRCKHEIHESMRGKPLGTWYIYIHEDESIPNNKQQGDLILAKFDQNGKSWEVLAVGVDGKLHLFRGIGWVNGCKVIDVEGIKLDELGRIVVES